MELKIFEHLKESGERGISAKDLATKTGADEVLIGMLESAVCWRRDMFHVLTLRKARTLKHLAAMNVVAESGIDKYAATRLSDAFTEPRYRDGIVYT